MDKEKVALLCVLGARDDGEKELIAMEPGYRESTESWARVLRDLRARGLQAPLLAIGDGVLSALRTLRRSPESFGPILRWEGLWAALHQRCPEPAEGVFPTTEHQRCWNHRALNVQAKLPKRLQPEARRRLRGRWRMLRPRPPVRSYGTAT